MASKKKSGASEKGDSGLVPVLVARSRQEAEEYVQLFSDHDIPATIGTDDMDDPEAVLSVASEHYVVGGVPVLVPRETTDEAREIVADREDLDEFTVDNGDAEDEDDEDDGSFGFEEIDPTTGEPLDEDDEDDDSLDDEDDDRNP